MTTTGATPDSPAPAALELRGIGKRFGAVAALIDAGLTVRPGTVHALLGENGAGKTTLMRVAYGMVPPDTGSIEIGGRAVRLASPADAIAAGIGMVHQHFTLVPAMTVAENLALGGRGRLDVRESARRVEALAERTGFALDPHAVVDTLGVGAQQRVEIAKALAREARVLVLDEPTAVLAPRETEELLAWLRAYVLRGNAAVLITHKLREALLVADDVTVLRRGAVVHRTRAEHTSAAALTAAMLGDALGSTTGSTTSGEHAEDPLTRPVRVANSAGDIVASLHDASVTDARGVVRLRGAACELRAGEITGVAGVEGSGQHELLRVLAGRIAPSGGRVMIPASVGFVPEDRHRDAVLLERPLVESVVLRGAGARRGRIAWREETARTERLMAEHDVRAAGVGTVMQALSGGNQQKLVFARELAEDGAGDSSPLLVVENPTRGLDVRAAAAVHARLRDASASGRAVVVYSSDLDEVLALADRVLVCYAGTVKMLDADREAVGRAMLGG